MTHFRSLVEALNKMAATPEPSAEEKTQLNESAMADTVNYVSKMKGVFNEMEVVEAKEKDKKDEEDKEDKEDEVLSEKWGKKMHTAEKDKGMWDDWTISELKSERNELKDKQASHKEKHGKSDEKTSKKLKQVNFAIRAKQKKHFGKIKESLLGLEKDLDEGKVQLIKEAISDLEDLENSL